jgi:putative RNA 2'-phosphotransferase
MTQSDLIISKSISYYLRHNPEELGIKLDIYGWTDLNSFINKISAKLNSNISINKVEDIMKQSEKQRFEIDISTNSIRAKYGHSILVKNNYQVLLKPVKLYHGTSSSNLESVKKIGLISKNRQYVHLTSNFELAKLTAKRWSNEITILEVNTMDMINDEIKIFIADNDIYLVDSVLSKYLII